MKLVLEIPYNQHLIVDSKYYASLLDILSNSKMYTSDGYGDNTTYTPSDAMPKIEFCKDSDVHGLEEALEAAKEKADKADTARYAVQSEKVKVEKRLKEVEEQLASITQALSQDGIKVE